VGRKKKRRGMTVKMGHGGTLDPLATGVLIVGVGAGTKALNRYLACTKTYETILLFGVETDSYDVFGAPVKTSKWDDVTKKSVEQALEKFRGRIQQRPPAYSARRVDGERLYDIARRGGEIPKEALKAREVEVQELTMLEWYPEGSHDFKLRTYERPSKPGHDGKDGDGSKRGRKRKRGENGLPVVNGLKLGLDSNGDSTNYSPTPPPSKFLKKNKSGLSEGPFAAPEEEDDEVMSGALPAESSEDEDSNATPGVSRSKLPNIVLTEPEPDKDGPIDSETLQYGPAVKLRMTVTSGFYVRSLCHDLAQSLDSMGIMAELVRTRQGEFELGKEGVVEMEWFDEPTPVVESGSETPMVDVLDPTKENETKIDGPLKRELRSMTKPEEKKGEELWAPRVRRILEGWMRTERDSS
jgi:tRNA pseudouridine55 synthase